MLSAYQGTVQFRLLAKDDNTVFNAFLKTKLPLNNIIQEHQPAPANKQTYYPRKGDRILVAK